MRCLIADSRQSSFPIARRLASPCSKAHRIALERLFSRITEVSSLPTVAQQILTLARDEKTDIEDLRAVIQQDPALTASLLRRVNSSYVGLRDKTADVRHAISLLGRREVRNVCLTVFVSRMFDRPGAFRGYSREGLWKHCQATAVAARKIARVTGKVPPDEAYVAGLLHHLGTILIDQHMRAHFCRLLDQLDEETPTHFVEREVFSFDHAQLGEFVSRRWNFPQSITDSIRYYQYPNQYLGEHRDDVSTLAIANFLCTRAGWSSLGVQNVQPPVDSVYASLGLDRVTLGIIWDELQCALKELV